MKLGYRLVRKAVVGGAAAAAGGLALVGAVTIGAGAAYVAIRNRHRFKLRGRLVAITGGSRGLGLAMARQFLRRGSTVALLARDADELQRAKALLQADSVHAYACDIKDQNQVNKTIAQISQELGVLDVLVNNAGTITVGPMDTMSVEEYREALDVYFWGALYTTMAALPEMRRRKSGRIVNISSIGGKISVPHLLPYSVGKFALAGFSEGLRAELAGDNVLVTTVYPGLMRTGSPRNAEFKGNNRAEYAWFLLSDATPGVSISADRAARQIVNACELGKTELIVSLPAKIAIKLHALVPGITIPALSTINRLLPSAEHGTEHKKKGSESETRLTQSWLTALDERAALKNNQIS